MTKFVLALVFALAACNPFQLQRALTVKKTWDMAERAASAAAGKWPFFRTPAA